MGTRKGRALPARLERVQRRIEHWRRTRKISSPMPDSLWAAAVKLAGRYGISHTAKTLRLNYNALRKRVEQQVAVVPRGPGEGVVTQRRLPAFLELAAHDRSRPTEANQHSTLAPGGSCQCILELENRSGAKLRVQVQGVAAPDLAALSRSFWEFRS